MINLNNKWNFEIDDKEWKDLVKKTYASFSLPNKKNNFSYPLNQSWSDNSLLINKEKNDIRLGLFKKNISTIDAKKLSISKLYSQNDLDSFSCNSEVYNSLGMSGEWEVACALHDFILGWQKGKKISNLKILSAVDEDFFYQQVKNISFKLILDHLLSILNIKTKYSFNLIISNKMFNNTDCNNNMVRLTYAIMSAMLIRPDYLILRPVSGITGTNSWKFACQAFLVIKNETEILSKDQPFAGAVFFESAVSNFTNIVWKNLQSLLKLNHKSIGAFIKNISLEWRKSLEDKILLQEVKVVGVNEFISPHIPIGRNAQYSNVAFLEKIRNNYIALFEKMFMNAKYYFIGRQVNLSKNLNAIYKLFACINLDADWTSGDVKLVTSTKVNLVLVLEDGECFPYIQDVFLKRNLLCMLFFDKKIHIINKGRVTSIDYNLNPFIFWKNVSEGIL